MLLILMYLSATNFNRHDNRLSVLGSQNNKTNCNYYVDPATGDLLQLNEKTQGLLTRGNTGIHNRKAAEEQSIFKVQQPPVYHTSSNSNSNYMNTEYERLCYIKKIHLHHWSLVDVPIEFKVECLNKWDIHKFSYISNERRFGILGDSLKGPVIIEYPYILGTLFQINKKYPPTVQILRNFVRKYHS